MLTVVAEYLQTEYDVARCSIKLLQSSLFTNNKEYVRRQIIYGLLQVSWRQKREQTTSAGN